MENCVSVFLFSSFKVHQIKTADAFEKKQSEKDRQAAEKERKAAAEKKKREDAERKKKEEADRKRRESEKIKETQKIKEEDKKDVFNCAHCDKTFSKSKYLDLHTSKVVYLQLSPTILKRFESQTGLPGGLYVCLLLIFMSIFLS